MTDAQTAQVTAESIIHKFKMDTKYSEDTVMGVCDSEQLVMDIAAAITAREAARERAVWLEAAEMIEEYKSTGGTTSPGQATICRLAIRFRQQAEGVKP